MERSDADVLSGGPQRPRRARRFRLAGAAGAGVAVVLGLIVLGLSVVAAQHRSTRRPAAVDSASPSFPAPSTASPSSAVPSAVPATFLGPGDRTEWGTNPGAVFISVAVVNLTDLDLHIDAVHLVLTSNDRLTTATGEVAATPGRQGSTAEPAMTELRRRSSAYVDVALRPDCTQLATAGYLQVDVTGPDGGAVRQRLELPTRLKIDELFAAACSLPVPVSS